MAEGLALGENTRFIVTSLIGVDAGTLYEDIYCARGQADHYIKHLKNDLAADRTSCTSFLANCMRLLLHAAAYVLHQQLRTQTLQHTALWPVHLAAGRRGGLADECGAMAVAGSWRGLATLVDVCASAVALVRT